MSLSIHLNAGILGLTVLAIGNSVGDWVADTAVARAGKPGMGIASCYGSPLLNDVLGLSIALIVCSNVAIGIRFHPILGYSVIMALELLHVQGNCSVLTPWDRLSVLVIGVAPFPPKYLPMDYRNRSIGNNLGAQLLLYKQLSVLHRMAKFATIMCR